MKKCTRQLEIEQVMAAVKPESAPRPLKSGTGQRNKFNSYNPHQQVMWLNPRGMLPDNHKVWFVSAALDAMDLSGIVAGSGGQDPRGRRAYDPVMLVKLIVYCRMTGRHSAREMERATWEDIPCRLLVADQHPDHDTIAAFQSANREALGRLFEQTLAMGGQAGLIDLDTVAVDGTKVKANASKHKAMSYRRMKRKAAELNREIRRLKRALRCSGLSEGTKGKLQKDLEFKVGRLERIKENKRALEERVATEQAGLSSGRRARAGKVRPAPKAQINFTDRESRIMPRGKTFEQAYNAQVAVDKRAQIIVAHSVTQQVNDKRQLVPMGKRIKQNTGKLPNRLLADSGFFSQEAVSCPELAETELFVPPGRECYDADKPSLIGRIPKNITPAERMRRKLQTTAGRAIYGLRKGLVEPVIGQIKRCMGFAEFTVRGIEKVEQEWSFICALHNLLKIYRSGFWPECQPA